MVRAVDSYSLVSPKLRNPLTGGLLSESIEKEIGTVLSSVRLRENS